MKNILLILTILSLHLLNLSAEIIEDNNVSLEIPENDFIELQENYGNGIIYKSLIELISYRIQINLIDYKDVYDGIPYFNMELIDGKAGFIDLNEAYLIYKSKKSFFKSGLYWILSLGHKAHLQKHFSEEIFSSSYEKNQLFMNFTSQNILLTSTGFISIEISMIDPTNVTLNGLKYYGKAEKNNLIFKRGFSYNTLINDLLKESKTIPKSLLQLKKYRDYVLANIKITDPAYDAWYTKTIGK